MMGEKQIIPTYIKEEKEYVDLTKLDQLLDNGEYLSLIELFAILKKDNSKKNIHRLMDTQMKFRIATENEREVNSAERKEILKILLSGNFNSAEIREKIFAQLRILDIVIKLYNTEIAMCRTAPKQYGISRRIFSKMRKDLKGILKTYKKIRKNYQKLSVYKGLY